jgi:hypothetical protein
MRAPPRPEEIDAGPAWARAAFAASIELRKQLIAAESLTVDLLAVELEVIAALRRGGVLRDDETPTTVELIALMKRMRGSPVPA